MRQHSHNAPKRQHGAAALMLAVLMVVFCATLAAGHYLGSRKAASSSTHDQTESLRWAQEAVAGFAIAYGRLPCAAAKRDGVEDCATGLEKGWLPVASIEPFAASSAMKGRMQVRYLVYRGTGAVADPDLAVPADAFQPALTDGAVPTAYPIVLSSVDLCGKLRAVSVPATASRWTTGSGPTGSDVRADRANVALPSGTGTMNIAYGLAAAPVGTSDKQSGLNADLDAHMESPYRNVDESYRDIVRVVDFPTLFDSLGCSMTMASLDGLAVAANWTGSSVAMRLGNIEGSAKVVEIEQIIVTGAGVGVVSSGLDLKNASESAAKAATLIATNQPLLPQPEAAIAVASGTAGAVTAAATLSSAQFDLVKATAGALAEAGNLVTYEIAGKKARDSYVWDGSAAVLAMADAQGIAP